MNTEWTRSTTCSSGTCLEAREWEGYIQIRNSRNPDRPLITVPVEQWRNFTTAIKEGTYDHLTD